MSEKLADTKIPHADDLQRMESLTTATDDDAALVALGYQPSFKREFTNLGTISFAFSIMGMCSSIATTFDTPLHLGGPSSVVGCWIIGATMCFTLGCSIAEIVSAFPTAGGLYTASAELVPEAYRKQVGYVCGWLNILGQIAGVSSTEFGLANMILAAVVIGKDGDFIITPGMTVGLTCALLILHGILNSVPTRWLANFTTSFVFINVGATIIIIITLLACTGRDQMHPAEYVFGSAGVINQTGGWPDGLAYMLGLLSVQWTMTDYDATAHISEEVRRAAYAAPSAIVIAVIGTGLIGWLLNIALVLCSGPLADLPGPSGLSFLQIMVLRMGKTGALILWVPVIATAFFVVQTALQAVSRTLFAFSRDRGLPDRKYFSKVTELTSTPLPSVWLATFLAILPPLLDLASPIAATAIFALTTFALDLSYIIPIACRRIFANHPEVNFVPGPFYLGDGILGWAMNLTCIVWTLFVCIILSLPTTLPTTATTMNYCVVLVAGVMALSWLWYVIRARKTYVGPVRAFKAPATKVGSIDSIKKE